MANKGKPVNPSIVDDQETEVYYSPVCSFCSRYIEGRECAAFGRIPDAIWKGTNKHTEPFAGDRGLLFERWDK